MMGRSRSEASRPSVSSCWRNTPRLDTSLARTSALISSAPARHRLARSSSPRSAARSAPREAATQHMTLDAVKCLGSPRTSQIPWSGSCQCSRAASTKVASPSHTGVTIMPAPVWNWTSRASRIIPQTSCCCWFQAPLPTRTGRAPAVAGQVVEGVLGQVAFPADAVHDLEFGLAVQVTRGNRIEDKAPVLDRFPVEAEAVQRAEHERRVADPGKAVVPVAGPAPGFRQRGGRCGHDGARRGVAEPLQGQRAAVQVGLPRMVGDLG